MEPVLTMIHLAAIALLYANQGSNRLPRAGTQDRMQDGDVIEVLLNV